jgi:hypothetical protein
VIELITGSDRVHEVVGRANKRVEECFAKVAPSL